MLFTDIADSAQVADRLRVYNDLLKRRIHVTQLLSDATPGLPGELRERAEKVWDSEIFPVTAMNFSKPVRDFFYSYDIHAETSNFLENI